MAYSSETAIKHAQTNALPLGSYLERTKKDANGNRSHKPSCAKYVADALAAAGLVFDRKIHAYQYKAVLAASPEFTVIDDCTDIRKGDIVVFDSSSVSASGHIAIYNGEYWISDFKQTGSSGFFPGPGYQKAKVPFTIFRPKN
jgi:hypothetical protein